MSNLLKALASPPFDYYPPWESKDEGESVLKQPDQIKVQYSAPVERANADKDMVGYVVPDQGSNAEFFLTFTLPMFKANIVDRLHPSARGNDKLLLSLMAKCLQGVAVNIWEQVLTSRRPRPSASSQKVRTSPPSFTTAFSRPSSSTISKKCRG